MKYKWIASFLLAGMIGSTATGVLADEIASDPSLTTQAEESLATQAETDAGSESVVAAETSADDAGSASEEPVSGESGDASETNGSASSSSESASSGSSSGSSSSSGSADSGEAGSSSASDSSSASSSEGETGSDDQKQSDRVNETSVVSFDGIGVITLALQSSLQDALAALPATVTAQLSDGSSITIPVDWKAVGTFDGKKAGEYTFASSPKANADGTTYQIGHPIQEGLQFPCAVIKIKDADSKAEENKKEGSEEGQLVMDDTTGANISAVEGEARIFRYLVKEMGLNHAAACGVLANIYYESNFNPHAVGDGGTSYGICQWHLGRYTSLVNFCNSIGLSYGSVEGQLKYLEYELNTGYAGVLQYLQSVPNTAEGAYQAGYYWCFHFERPAAIQSSSVRRGNAAKNSYWPRYKDYVIGDPEQTTVYDGVDYKDVYDYDYFLQYNPDLQERYKDDPDSAIEFFVLKGMEQGLVGSSEFDLQSYQARYADLVEKYGTDSKKYYLDYIEEGKEKGRKATACVYEGTSYLDFYDFEYYTSQYPDMQVAFKEDSQAAIRHFLFHGRQEGKRGLQQDPLDLCLRDL